ncbi:MAG: DUF1819 family protein [Bacillota bacterium]|nr:DUF1819 family protein [Bacillota bacterium]
MTKTLVTGDYTSNLMKGGALLGETFHLLRLWQPEEDFTDFSQRVASQNMLAKSTRSRSRDVLTRVFRRRFLKHGEEPARILKVLIEAGIARDVVVLLIYYWTALAERLLFDFVVERLWDLWAEGRVYVTTDDVLDYINELAVRGRMRGTWSEHIRRKTARGLLAALRDFGVLEGRTRKRIRGMRLPWEVAAIVAYDLRRRGVTPVELVESSVWRLFLVGEAQLRQVLAEVQQEGLITLQQAGSVVCIDWAYDGAEEVAHVIAAGAHPVRGGAPAGPEAT